MDEQLTTNIPPEEIPPKEISPEKVEVNKVGLEKLIAKVDQQAEEIKKLLEVADKGRLAHWESLHRGQVPTTYYLNTYNGKIITSWEMKENLVWKDAEGKWKEKQEIRINLEDGESIILPYVEFNTRTHKTPVKLISSTQKGEKVYLTVDSEGKQITIDSVFVN